MPLIPRRWEAAGALSELSFKRRTFGFEFAGGTLEHRRHRAARTAPRRPDVDQQRYLAVRQVAVETRFVNLNGMTAEDRLVAGSAARRRWRPFRGQPVDLSTIAADDLSTFAHVPVFTSLILAMLSLSSKKRS